MEVNIPVNYKVQKAATNIDLAAPLLKSGYLVVGFLKWCSQVDLCCLLLIQTFNHVQGVLSKIVTHIISLRSVFWDTLKFYD